MTDCPNTEMRDLLPEVVAGTLAPDRRASVDAHLAVCASCREERALLESARRALSQVPAVDVARVVAALAVTSATDDRGRVRPWARPAWQLAAAVALFAVGMSSVLLNDHRLDDEAAHRADSGARSAAAGQGPAVTLGHRLSELSERDLEELLDALDRLEAVPAVEPAPVTTPLDGAALGEKEGVL